MSKVQKEQVYLAKSQSREGKFHTDKECPRFPGKHDEWDRELAEAWDYDECDVCKNGISND